MNKAIQKMMMALAICGALCGTAVAAPKGNPPPKGKAPVEMRPTAPKGRVVKSHAPARRDAKRHAESVRCAPKHEIVRHAPPPPARHHAPERHHGHRSSNHTLHTEDWCGLGASLIGGLLGGLIGASL